MCQREVLLVPFLPRIPAARALRANLPAFSVPLAVSGLRVHGECRSAFTSAAPKGTRQIRHGGITRARY